MIKLLDILKENKTKVLVPRRSPEERAKNYQIALQKKIQQYIKDGGKGYLNLNNTPIASLPDNLQVGGGLYLDDTPITSLPDNLKVGGDLNLRNTPITSLPDNLKVGGDLDLENTKITSLPDNLQVGGGLYLSNTPFSKKYTKGQIEQMIEDNEGYVKGGIYI